MDRGSHSNASGAKRAGLTIPHLSVDKKVLRLCLRCACPFREFLCLSLPTVISISMSEFSTIHFRDISMRRIMMAFNFLFECDDALV